MGGSVAVVERGELKNLLTRIKKRCIISLLCCKRSDAVSKTKCSKERDGLSELT